MDKTTLNQADIELLADLLTAQEIKVRSRGRDADTGEEKTALDQLANRLADLRDRLSQKKKTRTPTITT